jgi:hypothetical protein
MSYQKTVEQFASIAEARANYVKQGYTTKSHASDGCIMTKVVNGKIVGEVTINREDFLTIIAEKLELVEVLDFYNNIRSTYRLKG